MPRAYGNESQLRDPAGVFAGAISLWKACHQHPAVQRGLNLSECYRGYDQLMREVMGIATQFETWACSHVAFEEFSDVWPYLLEEKFGDACLALLPPEELTTFGDKHCLLAAITLGLALKFDDRLPPPLDQCSADLLIGSAFRELRIQTVRDSIVGGDPTPFLLDDSPFDRRFSRPYFGLYGVNEEGSFENIGYRDSYSEILNLARKLAPDVSFPDPPNFTATVPSRRDW